MTEELVKSILQQYGSLGLVMAAAAYALRHLHAQLVESLEKRVADAQAFAIKLLALAEETHKQSDKLADAVLSSADASHEMRTVIERAVKDAPAEVRAAVEQALRAPRRPGA